MIGNGVFLCSYCAMPPVLQRFGEPHYPYTDDYGPMWVCTACRHGAYVGCHVGTITPLGRLANAELRSWRKRAHACFDPIWRAKQAAGMAKGPARRAGYAWLSTVLGIPYAECHMGMFDVDTCKRVVKLCGGKVALR